MTQPSKEVAPLVIDLGPTGSEQEGDGLEFFDRFSSPVFFDYDNDDYAERTAWVGPNEGLVVWDKDSDIKVWTEAEKDETGFLGAGRMKFGSVAPDEFVLTKGALDAGKSDLHVIMRRFDTNGDGKLDEAELGADPALGGKLYIWQDRNLDGVAQNEEVQLITNLVKEIDATEVDFLDPTSEDYLDKASLADTDNDGDLDAAPEVRFRDGSMIYGTAKVTLVGGATTTAYDMGFAHNELGIREEADGTFTFENGNRAKDCGAGDNAFDVKADRPADDHARAWSITGGDGNDVLHGGEADDMISGDQGADRLFGERGDDLIVIDADDTDVSGGLGYDVVMVEGPGGVTIDLTEAAVDGFYGGKGNDTATAAGSLGVYANGGEGNDVLAGSEEGDPFRSADTRRNYLLLRLRTRDMSAVIHPVRRRQCDRVSVRRGAGLVEVMRHHVRFGELAGQFLCIPRERPLMGPGGAGYVTTGDEKPGSEVIFTLQRGRRRTVTGARRRCPATRSGSPYAKYDHFGLLAP